MTRKKSLKVSDLTEIEDMSLIRIDIPNPERDDLGVLGGIYLRWDPKAMELNIEVCDFNEPLKGTLQLKSFERGNVVLKMGG